MKRLLAVALGVLTAIGGFVDLGDLVTNALVGARCGLDLAWVGVVGIMVFAEMSGRVAATTGRPTFDLVHERLGPRAGLLNLVKSMGVTLLTFVAEIGGIALALALALISGVNYLLLVPFVGLAVRLVLWRVKFAVLENVFGLLGLPILAFAVAVWHFGPDWSGLFSQAFHPRVPGSGGCNVLVLRGGLVRGGDDPVRGVLLLLLLLLRRGGRTLDVERPGDLADQRVLRVPARGVCWAQGEGGVVGSAGPLYGQSTPSGGGNSCWRQRSRVSSIGGH